MLRSIIYLSCKRQNVLVVELDFFRHVQFLTFCSLLSHVSAFKFCINNVTIMTRASTKLHTLTPDGCVVSAAGVPFCLFHVRMLELPFYGRLAFYPNETSARSYRSSHEVSLTVA